MKQWPQNVDRLIAIITCPVTSTATALGGGDAPDAARIAALSSALSSVRPPRADQADPEVQPGSMTVEMHSLIAYFGQLDVVFFMPFPRTPLVSMLYVITTEITYIFATLNKTTWRVPLERIGRTWGGVTDRSHCGLRRGSRWVQYQCEPGRGANRSKRGITGTEEVKHQRCSGWIA